jgi:cysteine desulfurase/selenocysteine lyase
MAMPKAYSSSDLEAIRSHFPILKTLIGGKPLVYLDNAATSQKPQSVIDRLDVYYLQENANIHRGVHALSQRATEDYEDARKRVAAFIGAQDHREVVFTRGTTESMNLLTFCLSQGHLNSGDTVLLTEMEHHANIVPWQLLRDRIGLKIATVRVDDDGILDFEDYLEKLRTQRPAIVSAVYTSNSLGVINPIKNMIDAAHAEGIPFIVDAAQAVPHFPVDVRELDCDYMVFSGHKIFGPTGIGVLYGKLDDLEKLPPYQGGGDMIESVSFEKTIFKHPPERFEAGTPNIAGAIGMAAGIEFLQSLDRTALENHEQALLKAATEGLSAIPGVRIFGMADQKVSVVSFVMEDAHSHDVASFLDADGIAVRSGHHCCQPLMTRLGITGTTRASFAFYNSLDEVDALVRGVEKIRQFFA